MTSKPLNILIPTDFSENAANALQYALHLYAHQECTFYLLHSTYINEAIARAYFAAYGEEAQNKVVVESSLAKLIAKTEAANANPKHRFESLLSAEELRNAVKEVVKSHAIDMVIMGTKGMTNAIEYVMGSNTIKVIRRVTECPILMLPEKFDYLKPEQITFPTDFTRPYDDKEIKILKDLADLYDSKIRVVHINVEMELSETQRENFNTLKKYLANYNHTFHWLPDEAPKSRTLAKFVDELEIDILAIVNYKHSLIERMLNEPVIKNLAFQPSVPILVIPK